MTRRLAIASVAPPAPADQVRALHRSAFFALLAAKALGGWGVQWDIRWHLLIGRDSFWIPPHVLTYAGVTLAAVVSLGVLALETASRERAPGRMAVLGLVGTPGWHLAWWGIVATILAAPVDELWHRLFGLDVTLWSPPHLLGLAGAQVNTLGTLLVAVELWTPATAARRAAVTAAGVLLLAAFAITVDPAVQTAFRRGGPFFFTWPLLASAAFGFTHVLAARLADWRWAPGAMAAGILGLHVVGLGLSDTGFALTRPVSAIAEAIAADPDSPIAIAHEMARRSSTAVGRSLLLRWLPVVPALLMVALDPRRRPVFSALAHALALLAIGGVMLARVPALHHARPGPGETVLAALLAAGAGAVAGMAGARLAGRFESSRSREERSP